jgi:hypothetical protein
MGVMSLEIALRRGPTLQPLKTNRRKVLAVECTKLREHSVARNLLNNQVCRD